MVRLQIIRIFTVRKGCAMFVIGITGGIGAGKSSVASTFMERGIRVLDADEISREVTSLNGSALPAIREMLGNKAIESSGGLNRKYVASLVFTDKMKLDQISSVIHRYVMEQIGEQVEIEREKGTKVLVLDVPIPVQKGFLDLCNQVWVISADESIRLTRLKMRGMDEDDAKRRMGMQMTTEEYEKLGDIVISNNSDAVSLEEDVLRHMNEELGKRGIRV